MMIPSVIQQQEPPFDDVESTNHRVRFEDSTSKKGNEVQTSQSLAKKSAVKGRSNE